MSKVAARRLSLDVHDIICVLALALLFGLAIPIVDPRGDFPLIDDWSFAQSVRRLVLLHDWRPVGWASMPLITHALWAAPVCLFTQCSFEALRGSTLLAAFVLLVGTYLLARTVTASRAAAVVVTVATVFNPLAFTLSYTFMTDVPFEASMVVAAFFCVRALRDRAASDIAMATCFAVGSTLCRQLGLCVPLGFCVSYWVVSNEPAVRRACKAAAPLLVSVLVLLGYETWLRHSGRLPALYDRKSLDVAAALGAPRVLPLHIGFNLSNGLLYLGLFCLPVTLATLRLPETRRWLPLRMDLPSVAASLLTLLAVGAMAAKGRLMPLGENMLVKAGIGPLTLRDEFILSRHALPAFPPGVWITVTGLSLLGAWLLVHAFAETSVRAWPYLARGRMPVGLGIGVFALVATLSNMAPLLVAGFFDRYLAVLVPLATLVMLSRDRPTFGPRPRLRLAAPVFACLFVVYAVAGTHDYLGWNRIRWQAALDLERSGEADPATLDGGFEYNGYRAYDPAYLETPGKSFWWVADDRYEISFAPVVGKDVVRRYAYSTYLPPATRYIYVSRRPDPG